MTSVSVCACMYVCARVGVRVRVYGRRHDWPSLTHARTHAQTETTSNAGLVRTDTATGRERSPEWLPSVSKRAISTSDGRCKTMTEPSIMPAAQMVSLPSVVVCHAVHACACQHPSSRQYVWLRVCICEFLCVWGW